MAKLLKQNSKHRRTPIADSALDITSGCNAASALVFEIYIEKLNGVLSTDAYILRLPEFEAERLARAIISRIEDNKGA